ncbi:unnamed protein product [Arabis nemorensis]|uniref:Uncharacterized protein n=1 Tax=Arabis nemorensis TaxID=586526 RepID=A0A565CMX4_9BRAS|nr:unnamed protein product [Arabis nemorensis]
MTTSVVRDALTSTGEDTAGSFEGAVCREEFIVGGSAVGIKGGKWESDKGKEGSGGSGGIGGGGEILPPAVGGSGCRPEAQPSENQRFCIL